MIFLFYAVFILVNVIMHEVGHAIPALFASERVEIYIGSFGVKERSFKISIGRLDMWFKKNPLAWFLGLCKPISAKMNVRQQIIFILAGPLFALILSAGISILAFNLNKDGVLEQMPIFFVIMSIGVFLENILPYKRKNIFTKGQTRFSDGYRLRRLLRLKKYEAEYNAAFKYYQDKEYNKASELFTLLADKKIDFSAVFTTGVASFCMAKQYKQALAFCNRYASMFAIDADGYNNMAIAKIENKLYNEALTDLKKAIALNPKHSQALNAIGYVYNVNGDYKTAVSYFEKSIELNEKNARAYNNLGYAKIKMGNASRGYDDICKAMQMDDTNAYIYRNMGIYFMEIGGYNKAVHFLEKAKEMDDTTYMIDELITEARQNAIAG